MNQVIVDGHDLGSFGLVIEEFRGRFAPPPNDWDLIEDPATPGSIISTVRRGGRSMELVGWINGPTIAEARANIDRIAWILHSRELHDISFPDRAGASISARTRMLNPRPVRPESVNGLFRVTIELLAAELPFYLADGLTTVTPIQATPVVLPAGSADLIDVVIAIAGTATDPEITIRDYLGGVQASLAFTLDLGGSDFLVLDLRRKTAYQNQTGQPNEGEPRIGVDYWPGDEGNEWFVLRAAWWDFITSTFASAECSSGTAEFRYRIASEA